MDCYILTLPKHKHTNKTTWLPSLRSPSFDPDLLRLAAARSQSVWAGRPAFGVAGGRGNAMHAAACLSPRRSFEFVSRAGDHREAPEVQSMLCQVPRRISATRYLPANPPPGSHVTGWFHARSRRPSLGRERERGRLLRWMCVLT
jgi:hypothetical protein